MKPPNIKVLKCALIFTLYLQLQSHVLTWLAMASCEQWHLTSERPVIKLKSTVHARALWEVLHLHGTLN